MIHGLLWLPLLLVFVLPMLSPRVRAWVWGGGDAAEQETR